MRIAISGPHGVGKTTLVKFLAERLSLPVIDEEARKIAKIMGFSTNEEIIRSDIHTIALFQRKVWFAHVQKEQEHLDFVADRSIFDVVGYMSLYGLCCDMVEGYAAFSEYFSQRYDLIMYTPIPEDAELMNDGFRLYDRESQEAYDAILRGLLKRAKCKVIYLPSVRSEWLTTAYNVIQIAKMTA